MFFEDKYSLGNQDSPLFTNPMNGGRIVQNIKNKKGQALVEAVIVIPLMLSLFFGSLMFASFFFDRMIVMYAAGNAINEGMGTGPETGITTRELQRRMEEKGNQVLQYSLFLTDKRVKATVRFPEDGIASFEVTSSASFRLKLPFVDNLLNDERISYTMEVDYVW
jgi:hypothetical protein